MNLLRMIEECEERSGFNDSGFRATWTKFLNAGIRDYARKYPWPGLEDTMDVVTDGSLFLVLPHYVDQIVSVVNLSDNLRVDRLGNLDKRFPGVYSDRGGGTPLYYDDMGMVPTRADPTFGDGIQVRSATNADSGASFVVSIQGYGRNTSYSGTALESVRISEQLTLIGTTLVDSGDKRYTRLISISKQSDTTGQVEILDKTSGDVISIIPRFEQEARFRRLRFLYAPTAGTDIEIRYRHALPRLRLDEDTPHPSVDHDFVVQRALSLFWRSQHQFTKAQVEAGDSLSTLQDTANKIRNFSEPENRIVPYVDPDTYPVI